MRAAWDWTQEVAETRLPPGMRIVAGVLLMIMGVFGFLPIIGFWMFPLGVAVAMMDIRPLIRRFRRH